MLLSSDYFGGKGEKTLILRTRNHHGQLRSRFSIKCRSNFVIGLVLRLLRFVIG